MKEGRTSLVGEKNRTTVPKIVREHLGIKENTEIIWLLQTDETGEKYVMVFPIIRGVVNTNDN